MERITKLQKQIVNESKYVGILYHFTDEKSLEKILSNDKMIGSFMYEIGGVELHGVSTTRNKNLNYDYTKNNVRITLNSDMISNNYKIQPRDYWGRQYNIPDNPQSIDEDEEVILTPKDYIFNIKKYIISIDRIY